MYQSGAQLGRFVITRFIGAGGMGEIYEAHDPELNRKVAIKVLNDAGSSLRLLREAQALAQLSHPNVVAVHDVSVAEGRLYFAMELIDGVPLDEHLRGRPRSWRHTLRLYLEAARGLIAAHERSIVHRDFKPGNVLVDRGGRVRVTDFGLARLDSDAPQEGAAAITSSDAVTVSCDEQVSATAPSAPSGDALKALLTRTGAVMGTPRYMAPEQRSGRPATARSDQYSFCLSLWEALFGATDAPARGAPRWLARVLEIALADDPAARWSSMVELVARLRRDPGATRRRVAIAVAALTVVGGTAFALGHGGGAEPCPGGAEIAGVWDGGGRARVRAAFAATGVAYAADTFARVDQALRARQAAWAVQHHDACAATRVRGEQSEALLDLRMRCLGRARTDMTALVEAFAHADAATVEHAVSAAHAAGDFDACADAQAIAQASPRPRDPARAAKADQVEWQVADLRATHAAGRYVEGRAAAPAVVAAARDLAWAPLTAQALQVAASLEIEGGDLVRAEGLLYEAFQMGEEGRDDLTAVRVLGLLAYLVGFKLDRLPEGHVLTKLADAALARAGRPRVLAAQIARADGDLLQLEGKQAEALVRFRSSLATLEAELGPTSPLLITPLLDVADALRELQRFDEARPIYARLVALSEASYGPDHPQTGKALNNHCNFFVSAGDLEAAARACERAVAIRARSQPGTEALASSLHNLGNVRSNQGQLDEARAAYTRAIEIREKALGPKHLYLAQTLGMMASVVRRQHRFDEALALARRALQIKLEVGGPDHPSVAYAHAQLGEVFNSMRDLAQARSHLLEALRIRTKALGAAAPATLETQIMLGQLELEDGNPRIALATLEPAEAGREKVLGVEDADLVPGLLSLSHAHAELHDGAGAMDAADHAQRIIAMHDQGPFYAAMVDVTLARAMWERNHGDDRVKALELARHARPAVAAGDEGNELAELDDWLARHR